MEEEGEKEEEEGERMRRKGEHGGRGEGGGRCRKWIQNINKLLK